MPTHYVDAGTPQPDSSLQIVPACAVFAPGPAVHQEVMTRRHHRLLIRTDATATVGEGHWRRSLALGQAWTGAGHEVQFLMAGPPPHIASQLHTLGIGLLCLDAVAGSRGDANITAAIAHANGAHAIFLDGYLFDATYQVDIKTSMLPIIMMDDFGHASQYSVDLVINQTFSPPESLYRNREDYTRLLLGTKYLLMREEFQFKTSPRRTHPQIARKILVTMGGADPENVTAMILNSLIGTTEFEMFELIVLIGGSNPHSEMLEDFASRAPLSVTVRRDVTDMKTILSWADIAVISGGTTCYEAARMSLPSMALILAENQAAVVERLGRWGTLINAGWFNTIDQRELAEHVLTLAHSKEARMALANSAFKLADGQGCRRVVGEIATLCARYATPPSLSSG